MKSLLWLGAWLIVLPFFGIPGGWKEALTIATGVALLFAVLQRGGFIRIRRAPRDSRKATPMPESPAGESDSSNPPARP